MWRFILLSFALMGWAFYELSDGADYAPRATSLQAALRDQGIFSAPGPVPPRPVRMAEPEPAALPPPILPRTHQMATVQRDHAPSAEDEAVSRALGSLSDLSTAGLNGFSMALANTPASFDLDPALGLSGGVIAADTDLSDLRVDPGDMSQDLMASSEPVGDIRRVVGDLVNMRAGPGTDYLPLDQVDGGTPVEVLEMTANGWMLVRTLDSGSEGWIADWLVSVPN